VFIGTGVGVTIGVGTSLYKDSKDDGKINLSIGFNCSPKVVHKK